MALGKTCNAQYKKSSHHESDHGNNIGLGMVVGGTTITVAGFLTAPDYYYTNVSSTQVNFTSTQVQNKPFFQQGPRTLAICTGVTFTVTGLLTMLMTR